MSTVSFLLPDGARVHVPVRVVLNAGYAGRAQDIVAAHIAELAALGVSAPSSTPVVYPLAPYLALQTTEIGAAHGHTSGEAEWALIVAGHTERDILITTASDHTDRDLEVHGVGWSKNAGSDVLAGSAWRLVDIADHFDRIRLTASVRSGEAEPIVIQDSTLDALLTPSYWLQRLEAQGLKTPGTVLLSGTIPMRAGVDQFADRWQVRLSDPITGLDIECGYDIRRLPELVID